MRRGQIFSMDALLSLVIVIMILGTVSATSENLKEEITSLIGWYERANIAENMLDVLTKSPGEPKNWEKNITSVVVPGLKSSKGNYIDYSKIMALLDGGKAKNPSLKNALWRLSNGHNFKLTIFVPNQSVMLLYNYTKISGAEVLTACNVGELGNYSDSPVLINASQCSQGEFDFTHDGVSFDKYYNPYYVCIYGNTQIGHTFNVTLGQYLAVNGSLTIGSAGGLSASSIYVTGDTYIGSNNPGYPTNIQEDSYIKGNLVIESTGNATFGGNLYVYGGTTVESTGYLTVGSSLYSLGQLDVQSNGNVNVSNDLYVGGDVTVGNSGNLWVGDDLFVNGSFNGQSSLKVYVGGTAFVNGSLSLPSGTLEVGDALYVNGDFSQSPKTTVEVYGDAFINGDMNVAGTNTFYRDLHVNGDLTIDSDDKLVVYGDLYVSGKLTINGNLTVHGNIYEYYSNNDPPIYLADSKILNVTGWLYRYFGTWYAIKGWGKNRNKGNYAFSGYKYTKRGWKSRDVRINNNYIQIKNWRSWVNIAHIRWNFDIQINGTSPKSVPPDKNEAFNFDPPFPLMPPIPEFWYPECKASGGGSSLKINVTSVNVTYEFSPEKSAWENISMIDGVFTNNGDIIEQSMKNSTWIQHAERIVPVSYKTYNQSYTINGSGKVLLYEGRFPWAVVGAINLTLPDSDGNLTLLSAFSTEGYTGYTVMVVVRNNSKLYYGLTTVVPKLNYTGIPEDCRVQRIGDSLIVPLECFVAPPSSVENGITFSLWVYNNTFPWVVVKDNGNIGSVMQPVQRVAILKLWVWGE